MENTGLRLEIFPTIKSFTSPRQFPLTTQIATSRQLTPTATKSFIRPSPANLLNPWRVAVVLMASTGVNVLRWSALGLGVFYGVYRQASLSSAAKLAAIDREYQHKQSLIEMAKVEYTKKNLPPSEKKEGGDIISDPEDSRFDLEAYLNKVAAETN